MLAIGFLLAIGLHLSAPRGEASADRPSTVAATGAARRLAGGLVARGRIGGDRQQSMGAIPPVAMMRNFYGVVTVYDRDADDPLEPRLGLFQRQHHARGAIRRSGQARPALHLLHAADRHRPHARLPARNAGQDSHGSGRTGDRHAGGLCPGRATISSFTKSIPTSSCWPRSISAIWPMSAVEIDEVVLGDARISLDGNRPRISTCWSSTLSAATPFRSIC